MSLYISTFCCCLIVCLKNVVLLQICTQQYQGRQYKLTSFCDQINEANSNEKRTIYKVFKRVMSFMF